MTKICLICKTEKEITEFSIYKHNSDGLHDKCEPCRIKTDKRYSPKISTPNDKVCIICKINKPISEFPKREDSPDGYRNECKTCKNERHIQYRKDNYEKLYKYHLEYGRNHRAENREKYREYVKNYRIKYPERRREQDRRRMLNPLHKIKTKLRRRLREILIKQNATKSNPTMKLAGCDIEEFLNYLESKFYNNARDNKPMTRELLLTAYIELDHIVPLWKFDLTNYQEQEIAFNYNNIQPLWKEDHKQKSIKDYQEYCAWRRSGLSLKEYLLNSQNKV